MFVSNAVWHPIEKLAVLDVCAYKHCFAVNSKQQLVDGDDAPSLDFFINEKSWLLFNILETDGGWLGDEDTEWDTSD